MSRIGARAPMARGAVVAPEARKRNVVAPEARKRNVVAPEARKRNVVAPEARKRNVVALEARKRNVVAPEARKRNIRSLALFALLGAALALLSGSSSAQLPFGEQKYEYEPADVLPGATDFVRRDTYWEGYTGDRLVGYVFLSDDLVEIPGYSGKTMNTLVGLGPEGKITGVRIVQHSEPIVLIGLSEAEIHRFVDQYVGKDVRDRILISDRPSPGYVAIDGISGATVTAVAENATVLEAGRLVGTAVGIVKASQVRKRRPADTFETLTWAELTEHGAVGAITVRPEELGLGGEGTPGESTEPMVDVRFLVLDPPSVGQNLLGERFYAVVKDRLAKDGGSAIYIGGAGSISFKGAGFARGGIFDRFSLDQAGRLFVVKDVDYINFPKLEAEGAPNLSEGGIFFLGEDFDPTEPFTFQLTVPYRIDDKRTYTTVVAEYQLPDELVVEDVPFWVARWRDMAWPALFVALFVVAVAVFFVFRQRLLPRRKLIHLSVAAVAALVLGLVWKAQPSMTQVLTPASSALELRLPFEIFLAEPLIFILWIAIIVTLVVWGRGFFCGWICPYGAVLELLISVWDKVVPESVRKKFEGWEPPASWRYGKYLTFLVILGIGFFNLPLAEMVNEVEPFKTFVLRLARPSAFVVYFVVVTLLSVVVHRFFCRFLCPLGGGLALPSVRPRLPLARYDECTRCQICYRGCEPRAISKQTGRIDYRECLQCWDCQSAGQDSERCPALLLAAKEKRSPRPMAGLVLVAFLLGSAPAEASVPPVVPRENPSGQATAPLREGRTWIANPGEDSLGEVIAGSADGDTIVVRPGVWRENVVVDKQLVIRGEEGAVIDAGGKGHAISVEAAGVVVEGLALRGCGLDIENADAGIWVAKAAGGVSLIGNHISDCRFGIWIHGSEATVAVGNRIEGMEQLSQEDRGDCVHLWNARGTTVRDNHLTLCRDGIYMELSTKSTIVGNTIERSRYSVHTMWCDNSSYNENLAHDNLVGLALMFSKKIEARDNVLAGNATNGLLLVQVTRGQVTGNQIIGSAKGIFVYNSLYNTIEDNLVVRNGLGMHYWGGSEDNEITSNAFVENRIQIKFVAARDQSWEGNYWSDYGGWDVDGDGAGEVAYRSNTLVDALLFKYPLAKLLLTSPAFQLLALVERELPVITVPKAVDSAPLMAPRAADWAALIERFPAPPSDYYGSIDKLPHVPGGN